MPLLFGARAGDEIYLVSGILYASLIHPLAILYDTVLVPASGGGGAVGSDPQFTVIAAMAASCVLVGGSVKAAAVVVELARSGGTARGAIRASAIERLRLVAFARS